MIAIHVPFPVASHDTKINTMQPRGSARMQLFVYDPSGRNRLFFNLESLVAHAFHISEIRVCEPGETRSLQVASA